jgi:hypothetical protein
MEFSLKIVKLLNEKTNVIIDKIIFFKFVAITDT